MQYFLLFHLFTQFTHENPIYFCPCKKHRSGFIFFTIFKVKRYSLSHISQHLWSEKIYFDLIILIIYKIKRYFLSHISPHLWSEKKYFYLVFTTICKVKKYFYKSNQIPYLFWAHNGIFCSLMISSDLKWSQRST